MPEITQDDRERGIELAACPHPVGIATCPHHWNSCRRMGKCEQAGEIAAAIAAARAEGERNGIERAATTIAASLEDWLLERLEKVEAERDALREALRIDGEQHATHIKALEEEHRVRLDAYAAEIERLREALVFYADDSNYAPRFDGKWHDSSIETDRGAKARAALNPKGGESAF